MIYLIMEFHIHGLVLTIYSLECMGAVTIHMTISIWNASVGKQKHGLVCGFRSQGEEVPEHVTILQYRFILSLRTCHNPAKQIQFSAPEHATTLKNRFNFLLQNMSLP
jgi:hypothetical protein